jgi:hypothetical protein
MRPIRRRGDATPTREETKKEEVVVPDKPLAEMSLAEQLAKRAQEMKDNPPPVRSRSTTPVRPQN